MRIDPDTGYQYQYPLWTKCSFTRYACNNFFFVRSFVQSPTFKWTDEIFISHPFGIVESGVLLSNINMHISLFIYFVFLLSFRGPVVLYVFANIQTGSNALHSRNRSDAIPMLSERYELRWPNKVSLIWKTEFWNWTPAIRGTMLRTTLQTIFNIPQIERQHEIPLQSDLTEFHCDVVMYNFHFMLVLFSLLVLISIYFSLFSTILSSIVCESWAIFRNFRPYIVQ